MKQKSVLTCTPKRIALLMLAITIVALSACKKDEPEEIVEEPIVIPAKSRRVFILNEGNYGSGNSSLSLYIPNTDQIVEDHYKTQNGTALGDVAQSITKANGKFYIVVNNSGKIVVCDSLLKKITEIGGLASPRYLLAVSSTKAYVSDLMANGLHVIDLNTNTKTKNIPCSGWTEQMVLVNNKVFVCNYNRDYVYIINIGTDLVSDSVLVGPGAGSITLDKDGNVWVLSAGDKGKSVFSQLTKINASNNSIISATSLNNYFSGYLCANGKKDSLYYLNANVYRFHVNDYPVNPSVFVSAGTKSFYGLAVNPYDYSIYVSDAIDFSQRSSIYVFDVQGNQKKLFKAGINSNSFYFE